MSYELLRGLYLGAATNADLTGAQERNLLHVGTQLDDVLPRLLGAGRDVVLTGNPGDGKSHIARRLVERGRLEGVEVILDLSAMPSEAAIARWSAAVMQRRPTLLCANEGPLKELLAQLSAVPALRDRAREVAAQLGRLVVAASEQLPAEPKMAVLIDLADRNLLESGLVQQAIRRICLADFLPRVPDYEELPAGRNLGMLLECEEARERLASLLVAAGGHLGRHVTFRELWSTLAFALTAGKTAQAQLQENKRREDELGTWPLDHLTSGNGQGDLIRAIRAHADPARVPSPDLDEDLWTLGRPATGRWLFQIPEVEAPQVAWEAGAVDKALERQRSLKRLVALCHTEGGWLVDAIRVGARDLPSARADDALLEMALLGIRRHYVSASEEPALPEWARVGLPLWVGLSYRDEASHLRPHVAVASLPAGALRVRRPLRPQWLAGALGPPPEIAWIEHHYSGVSLRLDAELISALRRAATSDGVAPIPEPVQRFLLRLSGWEERQPRAAHDTFVILDRPRGAVAVAATVVGAHEEAAYATQA